MLGENIKKIREYKKIGINKLGRLTGIAPSYISALENNKKSNPSQDIISKIASALEVPMSLLYSDSNVLDKITDKLLNISSFDGLGMSDMSDEVKKQVVRDILETDPSIFYELDSVDQTEFLVAEAPEEYKSLYKSLPPEAQAEIDNFMEYIKHKYNVKE